MNIAQFSVKRSLFINLVSLFVIIAGLYTLYIYKIRREAFPEVSYDIVIVNTAYPGAPPQEVERLVTVPVEKELKGVDGIEDMQSTSIENISNIMIKISQDVADKDKVVDDIKEAVDRVRDLPMAVTDDPAVTEITSGEIPVIQVALSGDLNESVLQDYAENLEDILEDIDGVSSVSRMGWRDKEVWVEVDPDKARDMYVSIEEIMSALDRQNISVPGGKLKGAKEFSIRTTGEFYSIDEIENVIVRANEAGSFLQVKDVASVRFAFEDEDKISKSQGTRSISLTVIKRATGDAIKIVDQVQKETDKYSESIGGDLKISYINDISYYIKRRLGVLKNNGIVGIILVSGVLMLFLNFRIALLTAAGLPIAFCGTIAIMACMGLSVNLITMFGLIIVLGMLVDDGIIVAENCSRYLEQGMTSRQAAIAGTSEVIKPVTTTIVTTIAAFAPLLFMEGMLGKFIWGIPLVVIIALVMSMFEAFIILPSHFADFVRHGVNFKSKKDAPWFKKLTKKYTHILETALNKRYWVVGGQILLFILTFAVAKNMSFVLFGSEEGIEQFYVRAEVAAGTNLYETEKLMKQIEEKVESLPKSEIDTYTTEVGSTGETWMFDPYGKQGSHVGQVTVYLKPFTKRDKSVNQLIEMTREKIKDIQGFEKVYFEKEHAGPPVGKAISIQVKGEEFIVLNEISKKIIMFLEKVEGVSDIATDYEIGRGEIQVVVDDVKAAKAILSVGEIATSVRNAFKGGIATSIKPVKAEEEIDVLVRFPENLSDKREIFEKILVPNRFGNLIPLSKVAELKEDVSITRIKHLDGKRVITVRADVDKTNITSAEGNKLVAREFKNISFEYPGYRIGFGGEQEENVKSSRSFMNAFALSACLIFFILAANFNSLVQPFIVMLAIPFGLVGVIWAFKFHGYPISFFMMMGVIGLSGIVVNDSIVLVDFINNLRRKGVERRESVVKAGQLRLRPVLLTTITTALGLTPTAYGIWGGDPFLRPMAMSIVWGIVCATVLTLIVLPCVYAIVDDITFVLVGHSTVKKNGNPREDNEE